MPSTLRRIDDPHDAPIAPDFVPADWAGHAAPAPANDAVSREKLFAEIRHAAETAAPAVDASFRATDVNEIPRKKRPSRAWIKSAATAFGFALISAVAAAAWKHHGDAATEAAANWVPLLGASSPTTDTQATSQQTAETTTQPAADQQAETAQPAGQPAAGTAALPSETTQQIQSMARDLAAMGQQIEQLKASIEALKANQQAAAAAPPPVIRAPAPPKPKVSALPPRASASPPVHSPRAAYPPAMQASAAPAAAAAAPPPQAYPAPPAYAPPPQATVQPNGEPVVRPPMPMPLSDRY